jgi:amino acid transporter
MYLLLFIGVSEYLYFFLLDISLHWVQPHAPSELHQIVRWVIFFSLFLSLLIFFLTRYTSKKSKRLFIVLLLVQLIPTIYMIVIDVGAFQKWNEPIKIPAEK